MTTTTETNTGFSAEEVAEMLLKRVFGNLDGSYGRMMGVWDCVKATLPSDLRERAESTSWDAIHEGCTQFLEAKLSPQQANSETKGESQL